jgi:copper(I)-binding protein
MLIGLSRALRQGDRFPLRFTFDRAGEISVDVPVKSLAEGALHAHEPSELRVCD